MAGFVEIGAFEAKTRFAEIVRRVVGGERFLVTRRGQPVALIVPHADALRPTPQQAVDAMRRLPRVEGIAAEEVAAWISGEEG